MGKWLPIISRVVTKTIFGEDPDRHWNVVQNNGMFDRVFPQIICFYFEGIFIVYCLFSIFSARHATERSL